MVVRPRAPSVSMVVGATCWQSCAAVPCCTPLVWPPAPTHLAQRASLLAGTASDVHAPWRRLCVSAANRGVTQRPNPRDDLCARHHASVRPVQCRSPSDPPNGSSNAPASASPESWVNDSRAWPFPQERSASQPTRRAAPASSKATARTGCGVPRSLLSTGVATALQASSNTYLTGVTTATRNGALAPRTTP